MGYHTAKVAGTVQLFVCDAATSLIRPKPDKTAGRKKTTFSEEALTGVQSPKYMNDQLWTAVLEMEASEI